MRDRDRDRVERERDQKPPREENEVRATPHFPVLLSRRASRTSTSAV